MQTTESLSLTIVEEIADREGVQPEEVSPPIHYVIDTDALDSLYQADDSERSPSRVEFVYKGYTVTVDSTGDVDLEKQAAALDLEKASV
ncbi:HalOD1 output domain-containing protein [Natrinema sp. 1APR25-10V2]|uniref:HalOD1 output domain-containing protein n=1 Tax=Natrinema sp. 1APR25-10V2 TaxID=2951081 RepID=UPI0028758CF2|nr:HalOD1 output domain-containing protein [Natrinema sp. 1APR25-10V2]MDS0475562.1 hypothetical protein [Natrinema sp. 1APR25-10V2]